jgi:membrane fusion protein (multidrug efflux system)
MFLTPSGIAFRRAKARHHIQIICLVLAASAASCTRSTSTEAEPETILPVTAEPVQLGDIRGVVSATGLVDTLPGAEFAVIAPQPGRIAEITKNVGDPVKSGELLVRFEFPSLVGESAAKAAATRTAELRVRSAKLAQGRLHGLFERGAAARTEVDDADREAEAAEAELAAALASQSATEAQGQNTTIRGPFNGVVKERLRNPGDTVGTAETDVILRIIDPRQVHLVATVPVSEATRFPVGASARAITESRGPSELLRVVTRPEAERGATTVAVSLAFDSPTELAPGTQIGVEIDAEQRSNVLLVPTIAVLRGANNDAAVFVAVGTVARRRTVQTGLMDSEHIEILSGLKPGELVITQGLSDLQDGMAITIGR